MDNKKMDPDLMKIVRVWHTLTEEQKRKIMWTVRLDRFLKFIKHPVPIVFLITLVQFIIWLLLR